MLLLVSPIALSVGYGVWLGAGQPGDQGSIPCGGKGFFL